MYVNIVSEYRIQIIRLFNFFFACSRVVLLATISKAYNIEKSRPIHVKNI